MTKFKTAIKKLKQNFLAFELVNLNDRPIFVRPMYSNEHEKCSRYGCGKKAIIKVHEIDKEEHYSDWDWCGNIKCDLG